MLRGLLYEVNLRVRVRVVRCRLEVVITFGVEKPRSITYLLSLGYTIGNKSAQHSR